jgi:hypothetical protein
MNGDDKQKLATSEYDFRIFMIGHAGRMEEAVGTLKENDRDQFRRIGTLETGQATLAAKSGGLGAGAGFIGGIIGGFLRTLFPGGGDA